MGRYHCSNSSDNRASLKTFFSNSFKRLRIEENMTGCCMVSSRLLRYLMGQLFYSLERGTRVARCKAHAILIINKRKGNRSSLNSFEIKLHRNCNSLDLPQHKDRKDPLPLRLESNPQWQRGLCSHPNQQR